MEFSFSNSVWNILTSYLHDLVIVWLNKDIMQSNAKR